MLPQPVRALILAEQQRQAGHFVEVPDLEAYLDKLGAHAELLTLQAADGHCEAFLAFYCNRPPEAYVALICVAPAARGQGLGRTLLTTLFGVAESRGFDALALEVRKDNAPAVGMYRGLGFVDVEDRGAKVLMRADVSA